MTNIEKAIEELFRDCDSHEQANNILEDIKNAAEGYHDEYISEHCADTGMTKHECDCCDCRQDREDVKADMIYDAMKVGEY